MFPSMSIENIRDQSVADAQLSGKALAEPVSGRLGANPAHLLLRQFRLRILDATGVIARRRRCSSGDGASLVFTARNPLKVFKSVVRSVVVKMINLGRLEIGRRRAEEGQCNHLVDGVSLSRIIKSTVAIPLRRANEPIGLCVSGTPEVADLILFRHARNTTPFFIREIAGIRSAFRHGCVIA